jgi:hypothetical protein
MAVAPAPSQPINNTLLYGIRPFDISRDLRPVAELIAEAFASELDGRGQSALREMRMLSYFGGMLVRLTEAPANSRMSSAASSGWRTAGWWATLRSSAATNSATAGRSPM